jgi:serine/threonine-protein kinase
MPELLHEVQQALGDQYRVERELGGGGMSRVFVARDLALNRSVVVKVLPPEIVEGIRSDRFRREIQLAARLQHPHIVPVLAAGESKGMLYYTMPFIEGESLKERLDASGTLSVSDAVGILRDVADALCYAHAQGVVHRDIKPGNILLQSEHAVVLDFGVAKALSQAAVSDPTLTATGLVVGTPAYLSPEQAVADPNVDHRADIYALGAVGYELLTGKPPFTGPSARAVLSMHVVTPAEPVSNRRQVPVQLNTLIMRCLEKDAAERWQSALELRAALDALRSSLEREPSISDSAAIRQISGSRAKSYLRKFAGHPRLPRVMLIVVPVVVVLSAVGLRTWLRPQASVAPTGIESVAVLPFENLSGSPDAEYFSDGMTDQLTDAMAKIQGLNVSSRQSSYVFKGSRANVGEIGKKLNVDNLVSGTVIRSGEKVRITVQLVKVSNGFSRWSNSYTADVEDVLAVQDSISRAIAFELAGKLVARSGHTVAAPRKVDAEATDFYLRGRFIEKNFDQESLDSAILFYQRALVRDPNFAPAYAAIANANYNLADDYVPPKVAYPKVRTAAMRALALDSTLAEAHASLANYEVSYGWNWESARREAERAVELDPNSAPAHLSLASYFVTVGKFDRAVTEALKAASLDPLSDPVYGNVITTLRDSDRHDLATRELRKMISTETGVPTTVRAWLAWEYMLRGVLDTARLQMDSALALDSVCCTRTRALLYAHMGKPDSAWRLVRRIEAIRAKRYYRADAIAEVYAALNDRDGTFRWLEEAYKDRSAFFPMFRRSAEIRKFSSDPRFGALESRLRLPQ